MTLHILLDPSGAYLSLEYSLVCSHLESLVGRIEAAAAPDRIEDPRMWQAYHAGEPDGTLGTTIHGKPALLEVRRTDRWLIIPKTKPSE